MVFRSTLAKCMSCELTIVNILIMFLGFVMQGLGFFLLVANPLTSDFADVSDFVGAYKVKGAPFVLGTLLMIAGYIGLKFVGSRRFGAACPYFTFLLLVLGLEVVCGYLAYTTLDEIQIVKSINNTITDGPEAEWGSAEYMRRRGMSKMFASFAKRFNDPIKYDCKLLPAAAAGGRSKTTCEEVSVECTNKEHMALVMNERCLPKPDEDSGLAPEQSKLNFNQECIDCQSHYYNHWIKGTKTEEKRANTPLNLTYAWDSDASLAFCRCYGRQLESWGRNLSDITWVLIVFAAVQVCVLFSSAYIYCCATSEDLDEDDDDDQYGLGMELQDNYS